MKLSLSLRCDKNLRKSEKNSSFGPDPKGFFSKMNTGAANNDFESELKYRKLRDKESFLLHPIDFHLNIKFINHILNQKLSTEAHVKITAEILRPIIFMMNKEQKDYLSNLDDHFKSLENIQNNLHIRPTFPLKKNPLGWFRYSVRAIIEKNRFLKLNFQRAMHQFFLMKKYIALYKKKQNIVCF